eukprot:804854-Prymnesium_polylepis.1
MLKVCHEPRSHATTPLDVQREPTKEALPGVRSCSPKERVCGSVLCGAGLIEYQPTRWPSLHGDGWHERGR